LHGGTSAPELVVSLTAGLSGEYGIALGNIIGSNIANILLIGGVAAILLPIVTTASGLKFNSVLLVLVSGVLALMVLYGYLNPWVGCALIAAKLLILYRSFRAAEVPEVAKADGINPPRAAAFTVAGMVLVGAGGYFLVDAAEKLALLWRVPPAIIGLTVVAIGTSVPELAATIAAARQKQGDLILGNIIGSNLANILIVFGFTALFVPGHVPYPGAYAPVLGLMMISTIALLSFVLFKRRLCWRTGSIFLGTYVIFLLAPYLLNGPYS